MSLKDPFAPDPTPDELQAGKIDDIRKSCAELCNDVKRCGPNTAMQTLALRKVEEFFMWFNKYIVRDTPTQAQLDDIGTVPAVQESSPQR
ncbi:MAG: hypothetical protein K2W95_00895 [Candidatus Obscuribacterales bacterium]|nr:hypothetical protein [Candidatus Obscuribacterales bacterium]